MHYIDPSSTSNIMQIVAPVFILISILGLRLKQCLNFLYRRLLNRPK